MRKQNDLVGRESSELKQFLVIYRDRWFLGFPLKCTICYRWNASLALQLGALLENSPESPKFKMFVNTKPLRLAVAFATDGGPPCTWIQLTFLLFTNKCTFTGKVLDQNVQLSLIAVPHVIGISGHQSLVHLSHLIDVRLVPGENLFRRF